MAAKDALSPVQMTLPGVDQWEDDARVEAVKKFSVTSYDPDLPQAEAEKRTHEALLSTKMPSTMLSKAATNISYTPAKDYPQWSGEYFPEGDTVAFNTKSHHDVFDDELPIWATHELGHKVDNKHRSTTDIDFLAANRPEKRSVNFPTPDPRLEGVADGFMDRYAGNNVGFGHQTSTSYGKYAKDWTPAEQAIYHASRAHTAVTGQSIALDKPGEHPEGTFLHKLSAQSPQVGKALKETGFGDVAQQEIDKFKSTRKVGTQLSFFGDADYDVYDFPDSHMGPQFRKGQPSS